MPRRNPLLEDYAHRITSERRQSNKEVAIAVLVTIVVCGVIFLLAF